MVRKACVAGVLLAVIATPALAEQVVVGNVGLRSVDVPTATLAPLEAALDRALAIHAPAARAKGATLSALAADQEVASRRAEARRSADAGANAMRQLELEKAQEEFDRAAILFTAAHGDRLEPAEVARIFTTRAKIAQMQRAPGLLKAELERALPLHTTKQLDANTFPPDTLALFEQVRADAARRPLTPPATAPLIDIARRQGLPWVIAGEVRAAPAGASRVALVLVDAVRGTGRSTDFLAPDAAAAAAFEGAVQKLFRDSGLPAKPTGAVAALATPPTEPVSSGAAGAPATGSSATVAAATAATPVPAQALPRTKRPPEKRRAGPPLYKRWYVVAGAAAVVVLAGGLAAASQGGDSRSGGGGGGGDPDPEGVTLVIDTP